MSSTGREHPPRGSVRLVPVQVMVAGVALLVAACGSPSAGGAGGSGSDSGPTTTVTQGAVTVDVPSVPATLNTALPDGSDAVTAAVASLVWPQVFTLVPKGPQADGAVVASASVTSVSPLTVVYQLNSQAVWSDGVPLTADDFVADWKAHVGALGPGGAPDTVTSTLGWRDIASVSASGDGETVTAVFKTPFGDWESLFENLLPAHVYEHLGWDDAFNHYDPTALVSGGPYQVAAWTPGVSMELEPNPRWWGSPVHVTRIRLEATPGATDVASDLAALRAQVGYPTGFTSSTLASTSSDPVLQSHVNLGTTELQLEFATAVVPFDLPAVRQGVAHLVDRASLVRAVADPLAPLAWEDNDHLLANVEPGYSDDGAGYVSPDEVQAARLFAGAGLTLGPFGAWDEFGLPVTVSIAWDDTDPWSVAVGPVLVAELEAGGFDVTAEPVGRNRVEQLLAANAVDLALVPVPTSPFVSTMSSVFTMSPGVFGHGGSADWMGFDDPRVDALFARAEQQLNAANALGVYQQLDQLLWMDMPSLPLFAEPTLTVSTVGISGVMPVPPGTGPLWNAADWALVPSTSVPSTTVHP